jgi:hypothetical protein
MAIKRQAIPSIDMAIDPRIRPVLAAMKENLEIASGMRGDNNANQDNWKRRSVTLGMLIKLGVITEEQARSVWQDP